MRDTGKNGFSLIEIMVAITILVMIVLMMSQLFHQSGAAWDSGMRKARGNLAARSVLGFMSRELQAGVLISTNHPLLMAGSEPGEIKHNADIIKFYMFTGDSTPYDDQGKPVDIRATNRVAMLITYMFDGSRVIRIAQRCYVVANGTNSYGEVKYFQSDRAPIINNVKSLKFETSDKQNHTITMPAWVKIQVGMNRDGDTGSDFNEGNDVVSRIMCRSAGPDRKLDTADDINTK